MPLEEIDADWLDCVLFNGMVSPVREGVLDLDAGCLVVAALEEAPEASREQIAAMLEIESSQLVPQLEAQGLPADGIAWSQGVVHAALLELRRDPDWAKRLVR